MKNIDIAIQWLRGEDVQILNAFGNWSDIPNVENYKDMYPFADKSRYRLKPKERYTYTGYYFAANEDKVCPTQAYDSYDEAKAFVLTRRNPLFIIKVGTDGSIERMEVN